MPQCRKCNQFVKWDKNLNGDFQLAKHDCDPEKGKVKAVNQKELACLIGVCFNNRNLEEGVLEHYKAKSHNQNIIMGDK